MQCVYALFYSGNAERTDQFIDVVDEPQTLVDKYNKLCPVKFFGDFNVQLPSQEPQSSAWYRNNGFSKHSFILYNFLKANHFIAVDVVKKQAVKYTYFCHKRDVHTWIDHALCAQYDLKNIVV